MTAFCLHLLWEGIMMQSIFYARTLVKATYAPLRALTWLKDSLSLLHQQLFLNPPPPHDLRFI